MRTINVAASALALCVVTASGCGKASAKHARIDANRSLGTPITFRNLSLVPIRDSRASGRDSYMTLDEGMKAKVIRVAEAPSGGDVNRLLVTNTGPKPVYLMAGEVVLGGQQDRCIGKDTVIVPSKRPIPISVYCVEHGRWSGEARFGETAQTVVSHTIRASAQDGAIASRAATAGRATRMSESQSRVWDEVAAKNRRFGAAPASGTYRDVLQGTGGTSGTSVAPYIKALSGSVPKDAKVTGVVVAINGKVVAADVFGESALFRKLWPKLLRSYAADAAEAAGGKTAASKPVTQNEARAFMVGVSAAKSRAVDASVGGVVTRLEGRGAVLYRSSPANPGGAAPQKALHENYLRK